MEQLLKQILEGQNKLFQEVQSLKAGQNQLSTKIDGLSERMNNLDDQTRENTDIIKAIRHNTEILNAKVDGLTVNTVGKEAVADLDAKFEVLNKRLFQQEADLQRLKKAQ